MGTEQQLLDKVCTSIQAEQISDGIKQAYVEWIGRFIQFHGGRKPEEMGKAEIDAFLTHVTLSGHVAFATRYQVLSALIYLYRDVLDMQFPWLVNITRGKKHKRFPVVLTPSEVRKLLSQLQGDKLLMASLLYGSGLRLIECLRLRIGDIDLDRRQVRVRAPSRQKDRITKLPEILVGPVREKMDQVRALHRADKRNGLGEVYLPPSLDQQYPTTTREFNWQYLFPADRITSDPLSGEKRRHHLGEQVLQRALKKAANDAGIAKPTFCRTLRHSFATHLLERGADIRRVRELLGHKDVSPADSYNRVGRRGDVDVLSALATYNPKSNVELIR